MRIVAGTARGRVLAAPKSDDVIRPTGDRVRETIFNVLGQRCDGLAVLDLYAGTGALGLEALSRGATKAVLVDRGREALQLCRDNTTTLGFTAQVELIAADALAAVRQLAQQGRRFELVFADPPYKLEIATALLEVLPQVLADEGVAVIETGVDEAVPERVGPLARIDERRFGITTVRIFRLNSQTA